MLIGRMGSRDGAIWVRQDGSGVVAIENPFDAFAAKREPNDVGDATDAVDTVLLAPCDPRVIVGIAQNGPGHPSPVQAWLKNPRTAVASGVPVTLRRDAGVPVVEGEIAVVLARDISGLTATEAHTYVLGISAVNDLSSPDRAAFDPRNFESKSGVGYTPLGPWIDTGADIDTVSLRLHIDGECVADTGAGELPVPIRDCLAYLAGWAPLGAGDVIMTGAPHTARPIVAGALVSVEVGDVILVTPTC